MSPRLRSLTLILTLWAVLAPGLSSCVATGTDKRILQYLNQEGFGKRYVGNAYDQNYVTIGDTVAYQDVYNTSVRDSQVVDVDGTILLPQAGAVHVAGMTRSELESFLTQKMSPFWVQTDIKVTIRTGGTRVYYMVGEVGREGARRLLGDITVFDAVLEAAPRDHTANISRVKLIRADPRNPLVIPINVSDMKRGGDSTFNPPIQENDIIYVPPTLLKQFADFVSGIIVPIISPFRSVFQAIFAIENGGRFPGRNRGVLNQ